MPTTTATVTQQQPSQSQQQIPPSSNQGTFFDTFFLHFLYFFIEKLGIQMVPTISIDDLSNGVSALKVETPDGKSKF